MYKLFLASRYITVRPVSYIAVGCIAVAIAALIIVWSIMNGFLEETREIIRGTTADVVISVEQWADVPLPREALEELVTAVPGVDGAVSRLVRPAIFKAAGVSERNLGTSMWARLNMVLVLGVEPAEELAVTDLQDYLVEVEDPALRVGDASQPFRIDRDDILDRALRMKGAPTVLVGEQLMQELGLRRGQAIDLVTVPDGARLFEEDQVRASSDTFVIAGAFATGHHENDMTQMLVSRDAFRRWTHTLHEVSEVYVSVAAGRPLERVRDEINAALARRGLGRDGPAPYRAIAQSWRDRHHILLGAVENERNILFVVLGLFVVLTCLITFAVLWTLVQEKTRDVGILAAMGAQPWGVAGLFTICGTLIAAGGCVLGLTLGSLAVVNINAIKDWIEGTFGIEVFRRDVYAFTEIPAQLSHGINVAVVLCTILFSALICLAPAWRAGRLDPVEALRHE